MIALLLAVALAADAPKVEAPKVEVLAFKATWCAPCKAAEPKLKMIETHGKGRLVVRRVDVDKYEDLAEKHKVTSVPTYVVKVLGKVVYRTTNIDELVKWLKNRK